MRRIGNQDFIKAIGEDSAGLEGTDGGHLILPGIE